MKRDNTSPGRGVGMRAPHAGSVRGALLWRESERGPGGERGNVIVSACAPELSVSSDPPVHATFSASRLHMEASRELGRLLSVPLLSPSVPSFPRTLPRREKVI